MRIIISGVAAVKIQGAWVRSATVLDVAAHLNQQERGKLALELARCCSVISIRQPRGLL